MAKTKKKAEPVKTPTKTENNDLTTQQKLFCQEYLIDLNGTQSAIRAGYSKDTAAQQASRLLSFVKIQAFILELMKDRGERTKITADRTLQEIEHAAMFDPIWFINIRKPEDIADLPEFARRAITGWSWDKFGNFQFETIKGKSMELLGRHHKLFTDKLELTGKVSLADRIRKARTRVGKGKE